jgi:hypothetical protein
MADKVQDAINRHAEHVLAHSLILQQILSHLAAKEPKLLDEMSQAIAFRFAAHETITTEFGLESNASVQRRVDDVLSAARRSRTEWR